MENKQYTAPIIIQKNGISATLNRLPISGSESDYNEEFIQKLAFKHPNSLPVGEIDSTYEGLIPVCCELNTPAGPLDILYVTPKGRLVIAEAKLWRNPEARRKVVAQIIDYAKELSKWDYEDLQREVSRATNKKGNVLYELVSKSHDDINEAEFVDEITRSLKHGRFLLLILGDGIREGVGAIAEFLENSGNLEFTFGLVELSLYRTPDNSILMQPRVLTKTFIVRRNIISLKGGIVTLEDESMEGVEQSTEPSELERFYLDFWPELVEELKLDDPSQPSPKSIGKIGNIFFPMPLPSGQGWLTVYFLQQKGNVGVFLTFMKGTIGDIAYESLSKEKEQIESELNIPVEWDSENGKHMIISYKHYDDLKKSIYRKEIKSFLCETINSYVNTFRPRLEKISKDL